MEFPNLGSFLEALRRSGQLAVVECPVSAHLEVAEIHRRVIAADGPALLFTTVEGADLPVATNLFGTAGRAEMAFGRRPAELVRRVVDQLQTSMPPSLGDVWRSRDLVGAAMRTGLRSVRSGPVLEVIDRRSVPHTSRRINPPRPVTHADGPQDPSDLTRRWTAHLSNVVLDDLSDTSRAALVVPFDIAPLANSESDPHEL